jgi:hypothetical protein
VAAGNNLLAPSRLAIASKSAFSWVRMISMVFGSIYVPIKRVSLDSELVDKTYLYLP